MGKSALWNIVANHFATLRNDISGKPKFGDFFIQICVPILFGVAASCLGIHLSDVSLVVEGVTIVSGLLFSMSVFLFQLRISIPGDKRITSSDITLIDECMINALWAITCGLALALYLIICGAAGWTAQGIVGAILTGVAVTLALHFLLVIAMCLKRLWRAYERIAMHRQ